MDENVSQTVATPLRVVGVKFKVAGTIYDFDAGTIDVAVGDSIVVEAERGMALAMVATPPRPWSPEPGSAKPLRVLKQGRRSRLRRAKTRTAGASARRTACCAS